MTIAAEKFGSKIRSGKIDFALGEQNQGIIKLRNMLEEAQSDEQIAALHYEIFKMETGEQKRNLGQKALRLYQKLYDKTSKLMYKKRVDELQSY